MKTLRFSTRLSLLLALFAACTFARAAKPVPPPDHWVGTWATASYSQDSAKIIADLGLGAADMTLREIVHCSLGGPLVRVELTNEFGTEPLVIGGVHLALSTPDGINPGKIGLASANALTFNGLPTITIPAGASVLSDPAALALPQGGDLAISIFLPAQKITHASFHNSAFQTSYLAPGNVIGTASLTDPRKITSWYFVKAVDVRTTGDTGAVVAFGDSITDGTQNAVDSNNRWPDLLERRLLADKKTAYLGMLNEGIGGNRILHDGTGPSALARFDRDVIARPGVKFVIILEAINDIGHAYDPAKPYDVVSTDDLIQGYTQLVERAHMHGIKVIGATLTPYIGAKYASPAGEAVRVALNGWIRSSKMLDGVVDFDNATRDPAHPDTFNPAYDRGDHLHPKDAGFKAMAEAFNLKLFEAVPKESFDIKVKLK